MSKSYTADTLSAETCSATPRMLTLLLLLGVTLGVTGCRTATDNQIDLLERELRVQENYIYELEDYVVEYSDKLRDIRSCSPPQMAAYSQEVYEPSQEAEVYEPGIESAPAYVEPSRPRRSKSNRSSQSKKSTRRRTRKKESTVDDEPELDLPIEPQEETPQETQEDVLPTPSKTEQPPEVSPEDIELPETLDFDLDAPVSELENAQPLQQHLQQAVATQSVANQFAATKSAATEYNNESASDVIIIPDPVGFGADLAIHEESDEAELDEELFEDEQVDQAIALVDRVALRLEVTQLFRGEGDGLSPENGSLQNGSPQNLLTVIEALDANGEPVDMDGEVSLMVMTTDKTKPKRLKRWNFTSEETTEAWQSSDLGDGLHLELPLDKFALPETPLELWVRLVTADGRKLLTQLPFEPSQLTDVSDDLPQPLPSGLALAETEADQEENSAAVPTNLLRIETERITEPKKSELAESKPPAAKELTADQPRWRASMQRTDRTAEGFATTTSKTAGWTTQAPERLSQPYASTKEPKATMSQPTSVQPQAPASPVWTSGRTITPR